MEINEIIGQALGILALCLTIICFQFNSQKKILVMQIITSILFMTNLLLLGGFAGALLNIHGICRALVFYQRGRHKWADSPIWIVVFIILAGVCVAVTYNSPADILPFIGTVFTTFALSSTDPKIIRRLTLPSSPCWGIYHALQHNIGGTLNEVFVCASIVVAMFRYDFKKNKHPDNKG